MVTPRITETARHGQPRPSQRELVIASLVAKPAEPAAPKSPPPPST